ncbi:MAG: PA3496 family putative envelope integrity protein [Chromatocurvus sp.]
MDDREQLSSADGMDDIYEPALGEVDDDTVDTLLPFSSEKQRLAAKRRRAERRLEERRLREELGDYELELEDY